MKANTCLLSSTEILKKAEHKSITEQYLASGGTKESGEFGLGTVGKEAYFNCLQTLDKSILNTEAFKQVKQVCRD